MSKSVVINLGDGDLYKGFPYVTAQLWATDYFRPEQFVGNLPPAPNLAEHHRNWQSIYRALCERLIIRSRGLEKDEDLEIDEGGITHVSKVSFDELCQKFQDDLNNWLKSAGFFNIERQLRSQLNPGEEVRVIFETNDEQLRHLPWYCWDFFTDYYCSEAAVARSEYKRVERSQPTVKRKKVRILAVLGNSQGIDLESESKFLQSLPDTENVFLVCPNRQEFNQQLWDAKGWDLLFFAGHSRSEGQTGRIYLNENQTNNSLTIEQLEEALKAAIKNGLRLAIFNSCDGLGLASALGKLNLPLMIVMREPIPNRVAQEFFKHFLEAFAIQRLPLYPAVRQARLQLQGLEDEFPGASWLPAIGQNPAVEPPTWLQLGGIPPCPYRGLFAFKEEDAELFCGRSEFTANLARAVKSKPLVAVVGASGSGKSSVVFAGLVPHLRQDTNYDWQIASFRPGNSPVESLAAALSSWQLQKNKNKFKNDSKFADKGIVELELLLELRQDERALSKLMKSSLVSSQTRLVLIVDQFEELYTLSSRSERQFFLNLLLDAVKSVPAFTLVITLRADFYSYVLTDRLWSDALQGAIQNLGSMSRLELRSAIETPAARMQVKLEEGLTDKLIDDVWGGEEGSLPLLEFALTQLWSKQQNGLLTHQAYLEIGGVSSALANHAETVYANLCETERKQAQQVFLQLVRLGKETKATRRLATRDEIKTENWNLIIRLASARLVVTSRKASNGEETAEIVHESLIKSWGRLQNWLLLNGDFRRWQEQLRSAIDQWQWEGQWKGDNFSQNTLLRGKPLVDASNWMQERFQELTDLERGFIQASLEQRNHKIQASKRSKLRTSLSIGLCSILAIGSAAVAWWQWQKIKIDEINALVKSSEILLANNDRLDALVKAIAAEEKLQKLGNPDNLLGKRVESTLRQSIYKAIESNSLLSHKGAVWGVAFSPDGKTIASTSWDNTIKLWSQDGKELKTLTGHSKEVWGVAFSPDGKTIASASGDKTIKLWQLDGKLIETFKGHKAGVWSVAFSPDGQTLASAGWDKTVKLWQENGILLNTLRGHRAAVNAVAISPDGQTIASASSDNTIKLWSKNGSLLTTFEGHDDDVWGISFSPDGQTIASASGDKTIKLWSKNGSLLTTFEGHDDQVWGVAFSPDGQTIASASDDKTIKLWQPNKILLTTLGSHSAGVNGVAFSPDGQLVASASWDKTVKLWNNDILLKTLTGHSAAVNAVAFSPDGQTIASASADTTIKLWNRDGEKIETLNAHGDRIYAIAFSPDGQILATASADNTVKLWNRDGTFIKTLKGHSGAVWSVSFSPDGQTIATASADNTVKLWNQDGTLLTTLNTHDSAVNAIAYSPNGNKIASASEDKTVVIWNLDLVLPLDGILAYSCDWVQHYLQNNANVNAKERVLCKKYRKS